MFTVDSTKSSDYSSNFGEEKRDKSDRRAIDSRLYSKIDKSEHYRSIRPRTIVQNRLLVEPVDHQIVVTKTKLWNSHVIDVRSRRALHVLLDDRSTNQSFDRRESNAYHCPSSDRNRCSASHCRVSDFFNANLTDQNFRSLSPIDISDFAAKSIDNSSSTTTASDDDAMKGKSSDQWKYTFDYTRKSFEPTIDRSSSSTNVLNTVTLADGSVVNGTFDFQSTSSSLTSTTATTTTRHRRRLSFDSSAASEISPTTTTSAVDSTPAMGEFWTRSLDRRRLSTDRSFNDSNIGMISVVRDRLDKNVQIKIFDDDDFRFRAFEPTKKPPTVAGGDRRRRIRLSPSPHSSSTRDFDILIRDLQSTALAAGQAEIGLAAKRHAKLAPLTLDYLSHETTTTASLSPGSPLRRRCLTTAKRTSHLEDFHATSTSTSIAGGSLINSPKIKLRDITLIDSVFVNKCDYIRASNAGLLKVSHNKSPINQENSIFRFDSSSSDNNNKSSAYANGQFSLFTLDRPQNESASATVLSVSSKSSPVTVKVPALVGVSLPSARKPSVGSKAAKKPYEIPKFHFKHGDPKHCRNLDDQIRETLAKVRQLFEKFSTKRAKLADMGSVAQQCGLPGYLRKPLMNSCCPNKPSVTFPQFKAFWPEFARTRLSDASKLIKLLSSRDDDCLVAEDFVPLIQDVVDHHPGLIFLRRAPEFHSRYVQTVIARIFYSINRSWSGELSVEELSKSNLFQTLKKLDEVEDINLINDYFSYEHFYVIYCKFWELDSDHDLLIDKVDLARHNDYAISGRIIDRIFSGAVTRKNALKDGKMTYTDFIWFLMSEEDKRTPTSIEYWFRCMDLDGDGYLSMFEMEYFYEDQANKMALMGIEPMPFADVACQMLDMLEPTEKDRISLSDLKRCKLTPTFFDTFINVEKYLEHEQKESGAFSVRVDLGEMSDWDRFAAQEYEALVAEEQQQQQLKETGDEQEVPETEIRCDDSDEELAKKNASDCDSDKTREVDVSTSINGASKSSLEAEFDSLMNDCCEKEKSPDGYVTRQRRKCSGFKTYL